MDSKELLRTLQDLAEAMADGEVDHDALSQAAEAVFQADHTWTVGEVQRVRDALDALVVQATARRDALRGELTDIGRKGKAVRSYGRPMGVTGRLRGQRVNKGV